MQLSNVKDIIFTIFFTIVDMTCDVMIGAISLLLYTNQKIVAPIKTCYVNSCKKYCTLTLIIHNYTYNWVVLSMRKETHEMKLQYVSN